MLGIDVLDLISITTEKALQRRYDAIDNSIDDDDDDDDGAFEKNERRGLVVSELFDNCGGDLDAQWQVRGISASTRAIHFFCRAHFRAFLKMISGILSIIPSRKADCDA